MAEDKIAQLYEWSEEMTKAGEAVKEKHEEQFKTIIEYVKTSDSKERILAAQLIARFFKFFPAHEESAFDSIVDLCESMDVDVRKHATMAMINICRDCKHLVSKAADILIQLYQTNQPSEVNLITSSLTTLLNLDIKKFLQSFFTNFEDGTEIVRERALKFLSSKIHTVAESALTKEVEEQLLTYSKKAMEDVTKDEFITFISILSKLKIAKTATGQAMIVLVIKSQAELDKEFNVTDTDTLDKFLLCTKHTIPLLSQYNRASEYVNYICIKMLPHLKALAANGNDLNVLQALAEMSPFIHEEDIPSLIDIDKCQLEVYNKLLEFLPLPPSQAEAIAAAPAEDKEMATPAEGEVQPTAAAEEAPPKQPDTVKVSGKSQETDFQFTHIEYLIFTFHQFGRLRPDFMSESLQNDARFKLQHLALGCAKYMELLSAQLRSVKGAEDLKKEENKLRSVALRTTKNISVLVRDLFKKPPQYKTSIVLSCKPLAAKSEPTPAPSSTTSRPAQPSKGQQSNNGNYNRGGYNRNGGQKHKYKQSYQSNKRQRAR